MLPGWDDVNPNKSDNQGRKPLSRAIQEGYAEVIALLQPLASTTPRTTEGQGTIALLTTWTTDSTSYMTSPQGLQLLHKLICRRHSPPPPTPILPPPVL